MPALTDAEIDGALGQLPGWLRDGDVLLSTYRRRDWRDALALVNSIGEEAERRDHHPDVCITGYRNVTVRLTTHSEGGITHRDVNFARWLLDEVERASDA
jgi:4a-hydroxytetrahydrobiopterin dehydratase